MKTSVLLALLGLVDAKSLQQVPAQAPGAVQATANNQITNVVTTKPSYAAMQVSAQELQSIESEIQAKRTQIEAEVGKIVLAQGEFFG